MGLIVDFTRHLHPDYTCKNKGCHDAIYNDIDRYQHKGWCVECYHIELDKLYEAKWDD